MKVSLNKEHLIHGIKTAIACLIGVMMTGIFGETNTGPWIVITIVVVMCAQLYVGSVMQKAYLRFLGTVIGTVVAMLTLLLFGDDDLSIAIVIVLSSIVFSYMAIGQEKWAYVGTLGLVTTIIILLSQHPDTSLAFARFFEISMGILIAGVVSQFILPINARSHLRSAQMTTLEQIRHYYLYVMQPSTSTSTPVDYHDLDESIVKSILLQRQLAKESAREPIGEKFNPEQFMQLLYAEREMLRAITFMQIALIHHKSFQHMLLKLPELKKFNDKINHVFKALVRVMHDEKQAAKQVHIPSLKPLKEAITASLKEPSEDERIDIDGFLFSADILVANLKNFAKLHKISFEE